jgi:hypothetical protein
MTFRLLLVVIRYSQWASGAGPPVAVQRPPGAEQRVLQGLVSIVEGAEHPVGVHVQGAQMRADQSAEGLAVARPGGGEQVRGERDVFRPGRAHRLRVAPATCR